MLERGTKSTTHFAFLVSVELADGGPVKTDFVMEKLSDALSWVEGTGEVDVECLGKIDVYENPSSDISNN
jgi:hypothetical protein